MGQGRMPYAPTFHHTLHGGRILRLFIYVCFVYDSFVPSVFEARPCLRRGGSRTARVSGHRAANAHAHTTTAFCISSCSTKQPPLFCLLFAFLRTNVLSFRQHRRSVRVLGVGGQPWLNLARMGQRPTNKTNKQTEQINRTNNPPRGSCSAREDRRCSAPQERRCIGSIRGSLMCHVVRSEGSCA